MASKGVLGIQGSIGGSRIFDAVCNTSMNFLSDFTISNDCVAPITVSEITIFLFLRNGSPLFETSFVMIASSPSSSSFVLTEQSSSEKMILFSTPSGFNGMS